MKTANVRIQLRAGAGVTGVDYQIDKEKIHLDIMRSEIFITLKDDQARTLYNFLSLHFNHKPK